LYAALHASQRGRRVLVLEHNSEPGAKILISGGGRCNFTNVDAGDHRRYLSANPHFARSALTRHPPAAFLALVEKHGIAAYEKTLGQLFCEGVRSSQKIVRMLLDECAAVDLRTGVRIADVRRGVRFAVETSHGAFESETLVIATGGLSIPKLGATSFGFDIARKFGVPVIPTRPGLVPLKFGAEDLAWMRPLSGVSAPVIARCGGASFAEAALFTHRGLSGPAILQVSSYWREGQPLELDWLPEVQEGVFVAAKRARPKALLRSAFSEALPDRLAKALLGREPPGLHNAMLGDLKDSALEGFARKLKTWTLTPVADEGFAKAEVTVGGVDTKILSQQNMECIPVPGLLFIGECVDVTGWLGGYNFQWAWSSGWAAGMHA
jgi:predicted Rossmann fold flavoprotein